MYFIKIFLAFSFFTGSIYSFSVTDTQGGNINLNNYQHKAILIVNIATGNSSRVSQLAGLQQLQQQYAGNLVVIGFPSNSFGNETRSNTEIQQFCQSNYGVSFPLAAKGSVDSTGIQPLFYWLTTKAENGNLDTRVKGDFQKFLIDSDGTLVGVFSGTVLPNDNELISAITASF